jgi:hypothetical protein
MPGRDAYLDGLLGNLDSPVLGGVERRNTRLEHTPPSIGSLIGGLSFPRLGSFPLVPAPNQSSCNSLAKELIGAKHPRSRQVRFYEQN